MRNTIPHFSKAVPAARGETHQFIEVNPFGNALKAVTNARYPTIVIERPEFFAGDARRK